MNLVAAAIPTAVAVPIGARVFGRSALAAVKFDPDIPGRAIKGLDAEAFASAPGQPGAIGREKPAERKQQRDHAFPTGQTIEAAEDKRRADDGPEDTKDECKHRGQFGSVGGDAILTDQSGIIMAISRG